MSPTSATECNNWVMPFVCRDKTLHRGSLWRGIGYNGCMHINKCFTLHSVISLCLNSSHVNSFKLLEPGSGVFYLRGITNQRLRFGELLMA